ncbi:unnamed protein product [Pleuronectes platessa]|uniref:Formamidopyrimidine-DNA glycosylase catalytic domain-containing protein n=1 Tax=Pleuronectes platessa TaxID=8262 RepID=A0A9N7VC27_PLEPL|nr:unnamed protein product [Pleuronectes platessa]
MSPRLKTLVMRSESTGRGLADTQHSAGTGYFLQVRIITYFRSAHLKSSAGSISWCGFICSYKMPEGPELHLASLYVNKMCNGVVFTGAVRKSEVSKSPEVPFTCEAYRITATSRGKEVKLTLTPVKSEAPEQSAQTDQADLPMDIVFRFGMSGYFRFTTDDELPKHSHLRF